MKRDKEEKEEKEGLLQNKFFIVIVVSIVVMLIGTFLVLSGFNSITSVFDDLTSTDPDQHSSPDVSQVEDKTLSGMWRIAIGLILIIGGGFTAYIIYISKIVEKGSDKLSEALKGRRGRERIMIKCRECGELNPEEAKYCNQCGEEL